MRRRGGKIKHAQQHLVERVTYRSIRLERRQQRGKYHLTVAVKRGKKQSVFVTEGIIQTASSNPQSIDQILNRGRFISLLPKQLHSTIYHRSWVKCFAAGHLIHLLSEEYSISGTISQVLS